MGAKLFQVSTDNVTYVTIPGNSAEISNEGGSLVDTVFGQAYESQDVGIINWSVQANGFYKGYAGYKATVKKGGTPVTMTAEATTLVSGKTYIITATTKRLIDPLTAVVVKISGSDVTSNVQDINYLTGEVTFKSSYTPASAPTIDGKYVPLADLAGYRNFTLSMKAAELDSTDIPTARANGGYATRDPAGLKSVSLELSGIYKSANGFTALLDGRSYYVIEICPDGSDKSVARGLFKLRVQGMSGEVGQLEEERVTFQLYVPDIALMKTPFTWIHTSTTMNTGLQNVIAAFLDSSTIYVKYLPDGTAGWSGLSAVAEVTLSGGLESMNEFSMSFAGSGAKTTI